MKYETNMDFVKSVEKLEEAIAESDLKIISRINAQENLKKIGFEIGGNQIFELFHPRLAKKVFDTNLEAGIIPPVRIYIYQDGGSARCIYELSEPLFSKYGLSDTGREVDNAIKSILGKAFPGGLIK